MRSPVPVCFHITRPLKILSCEMDPSEIRLLRYIVVKERCAEVYRKNPPVPHPVRVLKSYRPSCTVIGNQAPNCQLRDKVHTDPTPALVLYSSRIGKCVMNSSVSIANWGINFFCHLQFLTSKSREECSFAQHLCKLRKGYLTGTGHGAMVLKNASIFSFSNCQRRKKDHCTIVKRALWGWGVSGFFPNTSASLY